MKIYVDLDETLCSTPGDPNKPRDYSKAAPIQWAIDKINELSDNGHDIIIWTARGKISKINWREETEKQLNEWGVKYDVISFEKPVYDLLIDDKATAIEYLLDWEDRNGLKL